MVILIVEDEVLIGLDLHMLLSCAGYRVQEPVTSVASALAIAGEEKPDVAFVDVNLAGDEGLELARALRDQYGTTIIFFTAQPERAHEARDIALGVIAKPYDAQTPVRAVEVAAEARAGRLIGRAPPGLELFA
jgi:DNA-binding response OmpR family regulator